MGAARTGVVVGAHLTDDAAAFRRSIPTVVHQRLHVPLRVVVVDDDASPEARTALDELASRYPGIEVLRNAVRVGRAASRNRILEVSDEAAVAWLDVGDVWHPRKLAVQFAVLAGATGTDAVLVTTRHRRVDLSAGTERIVDPDLGGDLRLRVLDRDLDVPVGTLLGTADAHRLLGGFDASMPYRDDEELLLRFLEAGGRLTVAPGGVWSTGSDVRDRPSAHDVARAERRFRRLYGARMRALDPSGTRRAHRRELQRAGRLHAKADRRVTATAYRLRADLTAAADRAARVVTRRRQVPPRHDPRPGADRGPDVGAARSEHPDVPVPPELAPVHEAARAAAWVEAVTAWAGADETVRGQADPITVELVARSLRALERFEEAITVTEAGLTRWRDHPRIELELAKSRAATTDWSSALRPADRPHAGPEACPGAVTSLGPLLGEQGQVRGTVEAVDGPLPTEIELRVDGTTVVTTAADARGRFALACGQLREFLGDGDIIEVVRSDGRALALPGLGTAAQVDTGYPSRMAALRRRLAGGAVFTKFGKLRPGSTPTSERRTFELVDEVARVVGEVTGRGCTPFYGNLLGAVREQAFIAHDVGGFDLGYVSSRRDPLAVRAEFSQVCRRLLDGGYDLELEPFGAMIRRRAGDRIFVDLNVGWTNEAGELGLAFGWRYDPQARSDAIEAPRDTFLAGRLVQVPGDAEAVLHQVYGPGWATPDQGFDLDHELRRDERYLLTPDELADLAKHAPERVHILV